MSEWITGKTPVAEMVTALAPDALDEQVRAGYRGAYLHQLALSIAEGHVDVEAWYDNDWPAADLYKPFAD